MKLDSSRAIDPYGPCLAVLTFTVFALSVALWATVAAPAAQAADASDGPELHLPMIAAYAGSTLSAQQELSASLQSAADGLSAHIAWDLTSVDASGAYAVAFARPAQAEPPQEIILLAQYDEYAGWKIRTSRDTPDRFNAFLEQMPDDLLDAGDQAFLRSYIATGKDQSYNRSIQFQDHKLPWPGGQIAYVMQKDGFGHERQIDFDIQGNAASGKVLATKPGIVVFAKGSSNGGCPNMICWQQCNMVVVQHAPAEYSWYVHLAPHSVPVRAGDRVEAGSVLGVEGATGFASGVHLHYMTSTGHTPWTSPDDPNRAPWAMDIQTVDFHEASWATLRVGERYTSQNGSGEACVPVLLDADEVALFEHADYCGLYTILGPGDYPMPAAFGFYDDRVSSIRVGKNTAVLACEDVDYGGACQVLAEDTPNLSVTAVGNDRLSSLRVASRRELTLPDTPVLQKPVSGGLVTETIAALVWAQAERADTYQVQVSAGTNFAMPVTDIITSSTQVTLHALPENDYLWRVRAAGIGGLWSEWSSPHSFVWDVTPYRRPYLLHPADGAALSEPIVLLRWLDTSSIMHHGLEIYAATDSQLGDLNNMGASAGTVPTGTVVTNTVGTNTVGTNIVVTGTAQITATLADGAYDWRICRINEEGISTPCSGMRRLEIDTEPPAPPVLAAYADGETITDATPTFAWQPVPGATAYNIQIYRQWVKQTGAVPADSRTLAPMISEVTQETSYTPSVLRNATYGWRVRAQDSAGNWSEWSVPRTLTIAAPPSWDVWLPALSAQ